MQTKASIFDTIVPTHSDLLMVTESPADAELWRRCLEQSGWQGTAELLTNPSEIQSRCRHQTYHAILLDQSHPKLTPRLTSEILRRLGGHPPVILITDAPSETGALEGLASGAFDYVFRSCLSRLPLATQRAVESTDLRLDLAGADDQVREIEERFQALAESIHDGVAIEGPDGILYANQALADVLQSSGALELLGRSLMDLVPAGQRAALEERLGADPDPPGCPVAHDITLTRLDASQTEARLTVREVHYQGQSARLLVVQDRREQRRVEAVIAQLATFAQENPNPILLFAADGRMTYFNPAAMDLAQSFGREHPSCCVPPQALAIVETCLVSDQRRERIVWEQGGRSFAWSFFPHRESGVVHAFVMEITDQCKLEEQLRHSQRLEGVGRLAGGVAHEYNNLLTVIEGQARCLSEKENLTPEGRAALQQLLHASERAARITGQLQSFSRRNHVSSVPLRLNPLLDRLHGLLRTSIGADITLTLELDSGIPEIMADPALIEQAVLNLVLNAKDAMTDGGQLVISTSLVEIVAGRPQRHPESRPGRFVRLTVADTGCGMDPRILPYVFEPFFTTKSSGSVSGLGLSTTYGIVKQHNGWIEVVSQRGVGSTFRVMLPLAPAWVLEDCAVPGSARPPAAPQHTVLVVEDEPAVRYTLRSLLLHEGYNVLEASNPLEALALWREKQNEVTVLLTDIVMPSGISGQELARHLAETKPGLIVIYTSGYGIDSVGRGLPLEIGVNFLQKPFGARDFTAALQCCLLARTVHSPQQD